MPNRESEAIDLDVVSELFSEKRRVSDRAADVMGLPNLHQGRSVPSGGGKLHFGIDRLAHLPDAWIQAGRLQDSTDHICLKQIEPKQRLPFCKLRGVPFH